MMRLFLFLFMVQENRYRITSGILEMEELPQSQIQFIYIWKKDFMMSNI